MTDNRQSSILDRRTTRGGSDSPPPNHARELRLAATIVEVARELGRSVPPPRGAPYFCLDSDVSYDLCVLDALSARGIFRKYEFVLLIGSGLGGTARWLAARFGCRVLGVDCRPPAVQAATMLNQRARTEDQVTFQVAQADDLPLRERLFTHVWMFETPAGGTTRACAEAFRVLRRGGHLALHCAGTPAVNREALCEVVRAAGFVDLECQTTRLSEPPHVCRLARDRLRSALQRNPDDAALWQLIAGHVRQAAAVQLYARRPS